MDRTTDTRNDPCPNCSWPVRLLRTYANPPSTQAIAVGAWCALERCRCCKALWCRVPHEPYGSFSFWTAWPANAPQWQALHDLDDGATIRAWHDAVLCERWHELPESDRTAVEAWRDRTYRTHNPIDRSDEHWAALPLHRSVDLTTRLEALDPASGRDRL